MSARPLPLFRHLFNALAPRRQCAQLARLDDHLLCDIDLTRDQAKAEARQKGWQAPSHWLR